MEQVDDTMEKQPLKFGVSNNRSDPRWFIPVTPVWIGEGKFFFGFARNISRSGMLIHTLMPLHVGEEFDMEFTLHKTDITIRCRSRVAWNQSSRQKATNVNREGIEFINIDPVMADRIDAWLRRQFDFAPPTF